MKGLKERLLKAKQDVLSWPEWMRREASKMVDKKEIFFDKEEQKEYLTRINNGSQ